MSDKEKYSKATEESKNKALDFIKDTFAQPKIGVIIHSYQKVNPNLPVNRTDISKLLGDDGMVFESFSDKDIYHALAEFRYHKIPIVGFIGDNRSIHQVITAMIHLHGEDKMPLFIPFKGNNKSIVANDVNLDKDIGVIINKIKRHYIDKNISSENIKYIQRNTIKLLIKEEKEDEGKKTQTSKEKIETEEKYYGFVFGFGAIYRLVKLLYEGDPKIAKSFKSFTRTYLSILMKSEYSDHLLSKDRCSIKIKPLYSEEFQKIGFSRCLLTIISPLRKILDHYYPFSSLEHYESTRNESLNFMIADLNRGDLLKGLPFFIKGKYGKLEKEGKVKLEKTSSVMIETNAGIMLDGELIKPYEKNKKYLITIENGPLIKFPVL